MPKKKKAKTEEETRTLREQVEAYIFEGVTEFEQLSGIRVERIDIKHHRGIGFGAKDTMEVNLITE